MKGLSFKMMLIKKNAVGWLVFLLINVSVGINAQTLKEHNTSKVKVAFLADIHLHDIFANISNADETLLAKDLKTHKPLLIRSMYSQLHSTRLFNENYFAFLYVLDQLVASNIKLVALPGDFTDDGQPINIRALATVLRHYEKKYDMRFFAIPGNHDPVKPFTIPAGKSDFLTAEGKEFGVYSSNHKKCITKQAVCDDGLKKWGYREILEALDEFGFSQEEQDLLYEIPYKNREFPWCDPANPSRCVMMPDASYLVEPVKDVWLLAIDANVYAPQWQNDPVTFKGSSGAGYNALISAKPYLLEWIKKLVVRAKKENKTLIAFSHFPMAEFYDKANSELKQIFSKNAFSLPRVPTENTAKILAETGLTLHLAGHMHLNDTALVTTAKNNQLVNVQVPSLAAYKAAYKVVTLNRVNETAFISTHTVDDVPDMNRLFSMYEKEWQYRDNAGMDNFNKEILNAKNYAEFTKMHLFGLIEQRFLKREWPKELVSWLGNNHYLSSWFVQMQCLNTQTNKDGLDNTVKHTLATTTTKAWLQDFYLLRNGDVTADITEETRQFYQKLNSPLVNGGCKTDTKIQTYLALLTSVMSKFSTHTQGKNFTVDLKTGKVLAEY